jgi:hypothetical protein
LNLRTLAPTTTIAQLAKALARTMARTASAADDQDEAPKAISASALRRRVWRKLVKLHAADRAAGRQLWMYRAGADGGAGAWRINVPMLRKHHPELFDAPDPKDHEERLTRLEKNEVVLRRRLKALEGLVTAAVK